jgi:hydrogenase maturation protease
MSEDQSSFVDSMTGRNEVSSRRVLVVGLGNILLKDEGVGVHAATELQKMKLPENVEVIDGGTAGLDVLLCQDEAYKLVVIDATAGGREPGTIYKARFAGDQKNKLLSGLTPEQPSISLHQLGMVEALLIAEKTGCGPEEVVIVGIEPVEIDAGLEPSDKIKQKIPEVVNAVLEEIRDAVHER